jgi:BirA family biotin operon repressor/biotin-[acetyl-CoA-carboxylase] ligase
LSPATPIITLGEPLIELSSIDSTNIYAISQIQQQMAVSGSCYRTDFQTNGKGQLGRVWDSAKGQNLLCSYVLSLHDVQKPNENVKIWAPKDQIGLSFAVSLAVSDFFQTMAGEETSIKWPNDLYWRDRKAGGILIENTVRGNTWAWSIIGIGININQTEFSTEVGRPVSLKQITGKDWDIPMLLTALSKAMTMRVNEWIHTGADGLLKQYNDRLFKKGAMVNFNANGNSFSGKVMGVNEMGQLIVDQGTVETYNFGDLKWEI